MGRLLIHIGIGFDLGELEVCDAVMLHPAPHVNPSRRELTVRMAMNQTGPAVPMSTQPETIVCLQ